MSTEQADSPPTDSDAVGGDDAADPEALDADETESQPRVVKDEYSWEDFKDEYYYDEEGEPPTRTVVGEDGEHEEEVIPFDPVEYLGFDPRDLPGFLSIGDDHADHMLAVEDQRTVDVNPEIDEDDFFSTHAGETTITNRYDLEKAVPMEKKRHFREVERYWVNEPYAFVVIFHSRKENEKKYYLVEPYRTPIEEEVEEFLTQKLRSAIKYSSDEIVVEGDPEARGAVIEQETLKLLDRYDLYTGPVRGDESLSERVARYLVNTSEPETVDSIVSRAGMLGDRFRTRLADAVEAVRTEEQTGIQGLTARPEPVLVEENAKDLNQYQVEKLLYQLKRDFIGYERIDGIKHDIHVEDISCDGYNSPVFVYHTDYEQLISNVEHGQGDLDDFVVKMAQRSGKGISKRQPQVDATLPDGSRAQLTLGREVSDHGTNYTIRQFKEIPFTPVDLINWKTFSLDEMAFLWLAIENNKSLIFAGGTASGKTTSLNAVSLFIPSNAKIVSIEDTREVELPQRNWIASVTRPSFGDDESGDIDEFDLLEAALRQRPDYIVMGEIRGEEGRTLFQVMSTGHTTLTTFHADSVGEVLKRFTTEPINVSKTLFTALDLVSIQASTRVKGRKVRRNRSVTEINKYDAENDEINVNDIYQWEPEEDIFRQTSDSSTMEEIQFDRGWTWQELDEQLFRRQVVLAYLIENGLNEYPEVAATLQAFINDQETILTLIANDELASSLSDLRGMESVLINVDEEKEEMVPRPDPTPDVREEAQAVLERAEEELYDDFRGEEAADVAELLMQDETGDLLAGLDDEPSEDGLAGLGWEDLADVAGSGDAPSPADVMAPRETDEDESDASSTATANGGDVTATESREDTAPFGTGGATPSSGTGVDESEQPDSFIEPAEPDDADGDVTFGDAEDDARVDDVKDDAPVDDAETGVTFDEAGDDVAFDESADDVTFDGAEGSITFDEAAGDPADTSSEDESDPDGFGEFTPASERKEGEGDGEQAGGDGGRGASNETSDGDESTQ